MISLSLLLDNKTGLHTRPAALFVQTAKGFQSKVTVRKDAKQADGRSVFALMALGAGAGSRVELVFEGPDEAEAAEAIKKLFADRFGEH